MATKRNSHATNRKGRLSPKSRLDLWKLRLYVTGVTYQSTRAITNVKAICEEYLPGHYDLEIIDVYQQTALARGDGIIAAPMLLKETPAPLRRIAGDLANKEGVLAGLGLKP